MGRGGRPQCVTRPTSCSRRPNSICAWGGWCAAVTADLPDGIGFFLIRAAPESTGASTHSTRSAQSATELRSSDSVMMGSIPSALHMEITCGNDRAGRRRRQAVSRNKTNDENERPSHSYTNTQATTHTQIHSHTRNHTDCETRCACLPPSARVTNPPQRVPTPRGGSRASRAAGSHEMGRGRATASTACRGRRCHRCAAR